MTQLISWYLSKISTETVSVSLSQFKYTRLWNVTEQAPFYFLKEFPTVIKLLDEEEVSQNGFERSRRCPLIANCTLPLLINPRLYNSLFPLTSRRRCLECFRTLVVFCFTFNYVERTSETMRSLRLWQAVNATCLGGSGHVVKNDVFVCRMFLVHFSEG